MLELLLLLLVLVLERVPLFVLGELLVLVDVELEVEAELLVALLRWCWVNVPIFSEEYTESVAMSEDGAAGTPAAAAEEGTVSLPEVNSKSCAFIQLHQHPHCKAGSEMHGNP